MLTKLKQMISERKTEYIEELKDFISIPSISALSGHQQDINKCAEFLINHLRQIGFENVQLIHTSGNPVVYGDWLHAPGKPTVLVYGHYDVQPADPIELWDSPPFQPEIREGLLFGRGATDNKGQCFAQLKSFEILFKTTGRLPVNVKLLIEGEEEIGSPSIASFLEHYKDRLNSDVIVISDTAMLSENQPSICYALRGLLGFQIDVKGPRVDLHSGSMYGGAVQNPIHALVQLLASMRNEKGQITIDGFYEDVVPITEEEKQSLLSLPFHEKELMERIGVTELSGEEGYTTLERVWVRPTLEINGIDGGYQGEGIKTIIPSEAHAKVTCRLVPDQDPATIERCIRKHIERHTPKGVQVDIKFREHSHPYAISIHHPLIQLAAESYGRAYGVPACLVRAGGSIPIVEHLYRRLKCPVILMGFGSPTANVHAPNEHFSLDNFEKGILTLCDYWLNLASVLKESEESR